MADVSRSPLTPAIERARALIASGDLGSAQVLLERAVELGRENLGEDEPDVLTAQRELAGVFLRSDDPMAARRVLEDAYAAGQWRLGDGDPVMLHISHDLGIVAQELGNRHEARKAFGRVAANGPAALGEGHEFVVRARSYLGEDPSGATVRPDAPTIQPTTTPAPAPPPPPVTPAADVPPPMTPVTHTPPPVTPVTSPPPALTPVAGPPPPMTPLPSTLPPVTPVTSTPPPMAPVTHTAPPVAPVTHTPPAVAPVTNVPPVTPAANVRPPVTSVGHGPAPLPPFTHLPPAVSKDGPVGHMARDTAGGEGPGARSALERPTDVLPVTRTAPAQRAETTFVGQPDVTVQRAGNPWDAAPVVPVQRQAPVERHGHDVVPQSRHVGPPPVRHDAYQGGYGTVDNPHAVHQGGYPQQHHGTVQSTGWSTSPQQDSAAGGPYRRKGRGLAVGLTVVATLVALTAVGALVFVLVGRDDDGPVTPVATASAGVPQLAGDPPTGVKLKDRGASVDVTWKDPSDGKVPFIVTMARNGQQHSSMARVDLGRTKTTISGLNPNLEYCFAVVAVYSSDRFASSNQVCLGRK